MKRFTILPAAELAVKGRDSPQSLVRTGSLALDAPMEIDGRTLWHERSGRIRTVVIRRVREGERLSSTRRAPMESSREAVVPGEAGRRVYAVASAALSFTDFR